MTADAHLRALIGPGAVTALARRPDLWVTGVTVALRLAAPGWWRRWPPLPVPPAGYLRFRLQTMYGAGGSSPLAGVDAIGFLEWCRRQPRPRRYRFAVRRSAARGAGAAGVGAARPAATERRVG
ncbi:MAG TPA: hypothetical protein VFP61_05375 [Acidimicrobiales bacterium]|nr:hypothetical protein [Acidimicrobiales bacterium]